MQLQQSLLVICTTLLLVDSFKLTGQKVNFSDSPEILTAGEETKVQKDGEQIEQKLETKIMLEDTHFFENRVAILSDKNNQIPLALPRRGGSAGGGRGRGNGRKVMSSKSKSRAGYPLPLGGRSNDSRKNNKHAWKILIGFLAGCLVFGFLCACGSAFWQWICCCPSTGSSASTMKESVSGHHFEKTLTRPASRVMEVSGVTDKIYEQQDPGAPLADSSIQSASISGWKEEMNFGSGIKPQNPPFPSPTAPPTDSIPIEKISQVCGSQGESPRDL